MAMLPLIIHFSFPSKNVGHFFSVKEDLTCSPTAKSIPDEFQVSSKSTQENKRGLSLELKNSQYEVIFSDQFSVRVHIQILLLHAMVIICCGLWCTAPVQSS
jgi:hypothetical protein